MNLSRFIFSFGSPCNGQYGHLILMDGGKIYGYVHPNEYSWSLLGDELRMHTEDGRVTSRFLQCGREGMWFGRVEGRKWPLYLIPVLNIRSGLSESCEHNNRYSAGSIFVNSIPKSGTYYVGAALGELGFPAVGLHLLGRDVVDDYRGMTNEEMHFEPERVRLTFPVELVTALLDGEHVVGHVEHKDVIERIQAQGTTVISVIRDLRNVLNSLFRFKLERVAPKDSLDADWRSLTGKKRVLGFFKYFADKDLEHIRRMAEMLAGDAAGIVLRYEDVCAGEISSDVARRLDAHFEGISGELKQAFKNQYGQKNSTYSGHGRSQESIWSSEVEVLFNACGLASVNRALGYE